MELADGSRPLPSPVEMLGILLIVAALSLITLTPKTGTKLLGGSEPLAIVRGVFKGLKLILSDPQQSIRVAAMWLFMVAPLILAARRRWLPDPEPSE